MRRRAGLLLLCAAIAGCGDAAVEAETAAARAALHDALLTSRLEEMRVSAELYLGLPGNSPDLERFIADQHRTVEISSEHWRDAAKQKIDDDRQDELDRLAIHQAEFRAAGGDPDLVATSRRTAFTYGVEQARFWKVATDVAGQRSAALLESLRAVADAEAPSQRQVGAVRAGFDRVRWVIQQAFGSTEGEVGFTTHEQFAGLQAKLDAALGDARVVDPSSTEPIPGSVAEDVRAACAAAVGAVKFWRQFSLPSLAGTQGSERIAAATRSPFGWLEIASRARAP